MSFKYIRKQDIIVAGLHDELVMMDIEKGKYFSMNLVATHIWDLLEVSLSLEELCGKLMETYDVEADQCQSETLAYLNEMVKLGLIKESED